MLFYPADVIHFRPFGCHLGSQLWSLWQKVWSWQALPKSPKSRLCFFAQQTFSIVMPLAVTWAPTLIIVRKVWSWEVRSKFTQKSSTIFYPTDIFNFRSFGCHLVSQLRSLLQKCDPGKYYQNSHKSRSCFFAQQKLPIFIPLPVTWSPNLDPCDKSVILTGARKIHIKVVSVFLLVRHFPFSFVCLFLGIPTWILAARMWSWQARAKFI